MILSRLNLTNFRQYDRLELCFKDGITGIVGRNGSGKSTILEAVLWCLFGSRAARTGKEGIKRQTASMGDTCAVELEFVLGDTTYCLTRSLIGKNNRSEASLSQQGSLDAVSTREVDDYVVRLIGLNLKGFLSSFFARQKELNALSEARPADRKDHLARMLGVGRLDSAIQLLKEEIKSTRQKIDILSAVQIDPQSVEGEISRKKAEIKGLEKARAGYVKSVQRLETVISEQGKAVDILSGKEQEHNRLENEFSSLAARKDTTSREIERLTAEIAGLDEISSRIKPLKEETDGIDDLEKEVAALNKAKVVENERKRLNSELALSQKAQSEARKKETDLEGIISRLTKSLEAKKPLSSQMAQSESQLEALLNEHQELTGDLRVLEDKLATMEKQKSEINELGPEASCKLCLRPFAGEIDDIERHFDSEVLSLRHQIAPMKSRLDEITERGKSLRKDIIHYKEQLERFNKDEQELASGKSSLKALTDSAITTKSRISEIEKRLAEIGEVEFDPAVLEARETALEGKKKKREEYIRLAERAARKPEVEAELKKARQTLQGVDKQQEKNIARKKEIGFDREKYRKAKAELDKSKEEAGNIRVEIEKSDGQIRLLTSEAEAGARKLEEFEKSKAEIAKLRKDLTYLEKLSIMFTEFRVYLIGRIRPSLSKRTSQLFHEMTDGRYQEIELDEDYSLRLYDRGEHFPINRFSGGEVDLANLCFRLAISVEMAATAGIVQSFIILDEIFGSQDADRQRLIFEGLGRLKNRFRQIIIISHIDDVKEMAENIIDVTVDGTGISRAVTIEN